MWRHIAKTIGPTGVITKAELTLLVHYCILHSRVERATIELAASGDLIDDATPIFAFSNPRWS